MGILFFFSLFLPSCSRGFEYQKEAYEYLDAIDITRTGVTDDNIDIVCEALDRLNICFVAGILYTPVTSPEQVNMSEELFCYVCGMIDNTNNSPYKPTICKTKDGEEYVFSCVSFAISHLIGGPSFADSDSWIRTQYPAYNGGVPSNKIGEVMLKYFNVDELSAWSGNNVPDNIVWSESRAVGIYFYRDELGVKHGHMINIVGRSSNGNYIYHDYSQDTIEDLTLPAYAMQFVYYTNAIDSLAVEE